MTWFPFTGLYIQMRRDAGAPSDVQERLANLRSFFQSIYPRDGVISVSCFVLNNRKCVSDPDSPPQFLLARTLSDYEVELSWEPPKQVNSEILYYKVRVWNESSEVWYNVTGSSVVISVDSRSRFNASVSSWTRLGDGGVLVYITFSIMDAGPSDPPQNVSVVNLTSSSLTVLWLPPSQPNGIILHYTLYCSNNITVRKQIIPVSQLDPVSPGKNLSYRLSGLRGGQTYSLWLTSSTLQGDGGVQTEPLHILTLEDGQSLSVTRTVCTDFFPTSF
ncbi:phosphatidylinositol phosphatase PTPRQ-like [Esox lucius]|uniref:phosphatidylinositol phosphatase PTPRQ-like n=1 Tax=Esox lucius TaxID=8010 RepID=UPI0009733977|nr:phosphatidylinositol phosphatase PTPRQ-like [Esox lucius]